MNPDEEWSPEDVDEAEAAHGIDTPRWVRWFRMVRWLTWEISWRLRRRLYLARVRLGSKSEIPF